MEGARYEAQSRRRPEVLPEAFALDPEQIARLTREAQVLASLSHANIAAIYGYEEGSAAHALVLEFNDGPTRPLTVAVVGRSAVVDVVLNWPALLRQR